jgi:hypothetical protein
MAQIPQIRLAIAVKLKNRAYDVECSKENPAVFNHDGGASCGGVYLSRDG